MLHSVVGLTDVYLAGHLRRDAVAATAAIGSIAYILWLLGLIAGAIGTGSTALVARATGARHRSLANSVCGQTVTAAALTGLALARADAASSHRQIAAVTGLKGEAYGFALFYVRALSISLPFSIFLFAANACLRGAGDTITPAVSVIVVDAVNLALSASLSRGWFGLPEMGFSGIAVGTVTAYVVGGLLQFAVLLRGPRRAAAAPAPPAAALAHAPAHPQDRPAQRPGEDADLVGQLRHRRGHQPHRPDQRRRLGAHHHHPPGEHELPGRLRLRDGGGHDGRPEPGDGRPGPGEAQRLPRLRRRRRGHGR